MRVAVTGSAGMLGTDLLGLIRASGRFELCGAYDLKEGFDLLDEKALRRALERDRPEAVLSCAAYTNVDGAEIDPEAAFRANRDLPELLGRAARDLGLRVLHVSTDYVFDGAATAPYREDDPPSPLSLYGHSKLAGDRALEASGCECLIVRTSWLYGRHGKNFVDTIRGLAAEGGPLRVVSDQRGCPTWTVELASALLALAPTRHRGIVNFAGSGHCTWREFALEILALSGMSVEVLPITSAELGRRAIRPAWSVLDTTLFEKITGRPPLHWREALKRYLSTHADGG